MYNLICDEKFYSFFLINTPNNNYLVLEYGEICKFFMQTLSKITVQYLPGGPNKSL